MFRPLFVLSSLAICVLAQDNDAKPEPYQFNYSSQDKEGSSSHEESGDGSGRVQGSYSLQLADGRMRTVTYWADESGFHADVITNEQGTESKNPADVTIQSSAPTGAEAAAGSEMIATIVKAPQGFRPVHSR
ncbi:cuticle protein 10.9 [Galendromus occidentalis]|uniref:Cuticle protein 10.9 n=1 Tax=Galendromus occidentalis TaxID=34638 RepID=A0AAJ6QZ11_9ACAR|nr:cuticle protein 10.9 [Galendromus occidentalis]